jgi:hypothetical protein
MNRRETMKLMIGGAALAGSAGFFDRGVAIAQQKAPAFILPPLGYPYEALEPHIDTTTMRIITTIITVPMSTISTVLPKNGQSSVLNRSRIFFPISPLSRLTCGPLSATILAAIGTTPISGT